jgi:hypothetical protein
LLASNTGMYIYHEHGQRAKNHENLEEISQVGRDGDFARREEGNDR